MPTINVESCEFTVFRDLRNGNFVLSKRASSIARVYISGGSGVRDDGACAWLHPETRLPISAGQRKDSWKLPERQIGVKTHFGGRNVGTRFTGGWWARGNIYHLITTTASPVVLFGNVKHLGRASGRSAKYIHSSRSYHSARPPAKNSVIMRGT